MKREKFGSRLGFILISAGCAIGLKCLAFSVYYRKVWRSSICSDLSAVSCSVGIANHGNGIRSGSWKSGKYCTIL